MKSTTFILHCLQITKRVDIIHRFCSRPSPPSLSLSLSGYTETPGKPGLFHRGKMQNCTFGSTDSLQTNKLGWFFFICTWWSRENQWPIPCISTADKPKQLTIFNTPVNLINCDRSRPLILNYLSRLAEIMMYFLNRYLHEGCCGLGCVIRRRNNDLSSTRKQHHLKEWHISTTLDRVTSQGSGIRCHAQSGKNLKSPIVLL